MAIIRRPLTDKEVEAILPHLPPEMQNIFDSISFIKSNCWNCEHRNPQMFCSIHNKIVPVTKAKEYYECFEVKEDEPF